MPTLIFAIFARDHYRQLGRTREQQHDRFDITPAVDRPPSTRDASDITMPIELRGLAAAMRFGRVDFAARLRPYLRMPQARRPAVAAMAAGRVAIYDFSAGSRHGWHIRSQEGRSMGHYGHGFLPRRQPTRLCRGHDGRAEDVPRFADVTEAHVAISRAYFRRRAVAAIAAADAADAPNYHA